MLLAVSCVTFNKGIALLDYKLNKNYIAATLCENKDKPACCCRGKCFLKKQLQKDEDGDKNKTSDSKDKFDVSLFFETSNQINQNEILSTKNYIDNYLLKKSSSFLPSLFHPPANNG